VTLFLYAACPAVDYDWLQHANTSTTLATIEAWHTGAMERLCQDDDGEGAWDVSTSVTLTLSGTVQTGWTYQNGDDDIGSDEESDRCFDSMLRHCVALTKKYNNAPGACKGTQIMMFGNSYSSTFAHEVGHTAGLQDVEPGVYKRIMMPFNIAEREGMGGGANRCRVIASERAAYLQL